MRVHIRDTSQSTFCGVQGESISLRHVQEQPQHVASLPMCIGCRLVMHMERLSREIDDLGAACQRTVPTILA